MADIFEGPGAGQNPFKGSSKAIALGAVAIIVIFLINASFETIRPGQKGVVFSRFGGIQERILNEGLQFKVPFIEFIIPMDVRIQKAETPSQASSKDLQMVTSRIAVNYHIDPGKVNDVYQKIGMNFKDRVIDPSVQEAVKAATAQYTAEELIGKREEVKEVMKENLRTRLSQFHIIVDELNIIDFTFSKSFNDAIEQKQTGDQRRQKALIDKERIIIEGQQKVIKAKAEADAQKLQSETVTVEILQLRAIEKWDGKLPTVSGGAMPFIDIDKIRK